MKRHIAITLLFLSLTSAALLSRAVGSVPEVSDAVQTPTIQAAEAPKSTATPETAIVVAPQPAAQSQATPLTEASPGMTVYKDPDTGRLLPLPADELQRLLTKDLRSAISTSQDGLVETAAPGGGVMIDLRGRFRNMTWATVGPDGKVVTHCDSSESPIINPPQAPKE
jgi:hypothetical protein